MVFDGNQIPFPEVFIVNLGNIRSDKMLISDELGLRIGWPCLLESQGVTCPGIHV